MVIHWDSLKFAIVDMSNSAEALVTPPSKKNNEYRASFFQHHQTNEASRFNVIAMSPSETKIPYTIDWIQNAFM